MSMVYICGDQLNMTIMNNTLVCKPVYMHVYMYACMNVSVYVCI